MIFSKGVLEKEIDLTPPIKDRNKKKKKNPNKVCNLTTDIN